MLHEAEEREQAVKAIVAFRDEISEVRKDVAIATQEILVSEGELL